MLLAEQPAQLVAVLGHELRNPLASAIVQVSLARELTAAGDPRGTQLELALSELRRVGDLLGAYLALGSGRALPAEGIDLGALAAELTAGSLALRIGASEAGLRVCGSRCLLRRCLENLLENAARAGARHAELQIGSDGSDAVVTVRDDGPGITATQHAALFTPFVSDSGSSGIGLALVQAILALHGGSIELLPADAGAAFQLRLPRRS